MASDTTDWGSAVGSVLHDTNSEVRNNLVAAAGTNPDQAARIAHLSEFLGQPAESVAADQPAAEAQVKAAQNTTLAETHPPVAKVLADPQGAALAHDDIDNLKKVSDLGKLWNPKTHQYDSDPNVHPGGFSVAGEALKGLGGGFNKLLKNFGIVLGAPAMLYDKAASLMTGRDTTNAQDFMFGGAKAFEDNEQAFAPNPATGIGAKAVNSAGSLLGTLSQIVLTGGGAEAPAAAQTTGELLGQVASHATKAMAVPALTDAIDTGHSVYDITGSGVQAAQAAEAQYAATTLGGAVPLSAPGKLATRLIGGAASGTVTGELSRRITNSALPFQLQQPVTADSLILNALTGSVLGGVMGPRGEPGYHSDIRQTYNDAAAAEATQRALGAVEQLGKLSAESKLRTRDPARFKQFVQDVTDGGALDAVYVDAKDFVNTLGQAGVTPEQLQQTMPEVASQIHEAMQTSGDIRIPVADYATHIAGGPAEAALLPKLKADPAGPTYETAQAHEQELTASLQKQAQAIADAHQGDQQFQAEAQHIHDDVLGQLGGVSRFRSETNKAYAALVRDFYVTQAERLGTTPGELWAKAPLRVQAESPVGDALEQPVFHGSPHSFDKFDMSKIGTGEGAQSYGHGLYFAENPAVATNYYRMLSNEPGLSYMRLGARTIGAHNAFDYSPRDNSAKENVRGTLAEGLLIDEHQLYHLGKAGFKDHALGMLDRLIERYKEEGYHEGVVGGMDLKRELERPGAIGIGFHKTKGGVYQAEIPDEHVAKMLDWDKPLSEQPANVKAALADLKLPDVATGAQVYDALKNRAMSALEPSQRQGLENYQVDASRYLADRGVPGIRYLDQGSRADGEGSHNIVLFNAEHAQITHVNGSPFSRTLEQANRGLYSPSAKTITLLKSADLSTFLHETGHHFLEMMAGAADHPGVGADFDKLLDWFGVKPREGTTALETWRAMSIDQQREAHEKFARGFEAYLMEGKAPSVEQASIFGKFRSWLLHVYQSLKNLNVQLTPEVRGVMDRMLASEQAIKGAEAVRGMRPLFESAADAGMTPEKFAEYQSQGAAATEAAVSELQTKSVKDMQWLSNAKGRAMSKLQAQADRQRAAIREEVEAEVAKQPVEQARTYLKGGELAGQGETDPRAHKLNAEAVEGTIPQDDVAKLGGMVTKSGTLHPDVAAELFGFEDGRALVDALLSEEPTASKIEGLTDQRMLERHGDLATPDGVERAAEAAIHNDARARFVATELKALSRATGRASDLLKAAKVAADAAIAAKRVRDLRPSDYAAGEAKAARLAEAALKKGKTAEAAVEKRSQMLNNQLFKSATRAAEVVQKGIDYLKRFDNPKVREGIDLEYRDQIDALLDRFDLRKSVTNTALDKREALNAFVERMATQGYEPNIAESLLDEAKRTHFKDMPVEQFKGLVDAVKSIEHLGKLKTRLLDLKEQREVNDLVDEMKVTTDALPQQKAESTRGLTRMASKWLNVKAAGRSARAALLKMEQMFDWLDARNAKGVFNRVVFRRISDAGAHESELQRGVAKQLNDLIKQIPKEVLKDGSRIFTAKGLADSATGEPLRVTKKELLGIAGNVGNESNLAKMLAGEKWSEPALWDFLHESMAKADWDFVQGLGGTMESLWPAKLEMSRRLGNTNPEKIQPRTFSTPHGDYAGWYWPLMYDPARSQDVAERSAKKGDQLFENTYTRANTDTGRMNTRNENYARPLLLSIDAIPRVIRDEIHDVSFREAIIDSDKFLSDGRVRKAIIGTLGQEHYDQLRPWLQSIANDGHTDDASGRAIKFFYGVARGARTRATILGLGYRFSTMLVHGASASLESLAELGPKWLAAGIKDFSNPTQWAANKDFVFERSPEMRNRMNEVDRDVRDHLRQMELHSLDPATSAAARGLDVVKRNAYMGIAMLDMASALPTWMGAYHKAMAEGGSEADAVYAADKQVRNAHGGTGVKDLAAVQRGNELWKLFTMFYTFWNHNINRIMDTARLAKGLPTSKNFQGDLGMVIMRTLIYTFGIQIMHSALHPSKDEEGHQGWLAWAGKEIGGALTAGIPIARDLAAHYLEGRDYSATPAASAVDTFDRSVKDASVLAHGQTPDKWVKHTINTAGYALGLPTGQAAATGQFLWDVADGNQHPDTVKDWWNGMLTGDERSH